jgi:hypothetical protein
LARHWQRTVIGLNETAMRVNELLTRIIHG